MDNIITVNCDCGGTYQLQIGTSHYTSYGKSFINHCLTEQCKNHLKKYKYNEDGTIKIYKPKDLIKEAYPNRYKQIKTSTYDRFVSLPYYTEL